MPDVNSAGHRGYEWLAMFCIGKYKSLGIICVFLSYVYICSGNIGF